MASGSAEAGAPRGGVGGEEGVVLAVGVKLGAAEARRRPEVAPGARRQQNEKRQRETQQSTGEEEEAEPENAYGRGEGRGRGRRGKGREICTI